MSTIVKKGKIMADVVDSYVVSVQNTEAMDNGSQVILGAPVSGSLGLYACTKPSAVTTQDVYMVLSPVIPKAVINGVEYRIDLSDPQAFTNVANYPAVAIKVAVGDEFVVSSVGFASTPTVNQYAIPANSAYTLAPATDLSGNTLVAYLVTATESISVGAGFVTAYRLRVVKSV